MSQENVEKLRASLATWDGVVLRPEERPFERVFSQAVRALMNADAVYESAVLPDQAGEVYRGSDAWIRAAETWVAPCEWMVVDLEQVLDAGEQVVSLHRARMKMRETGLEFDMPLAYVYTFRDGDIVHTRALGDHSQALASAGLAE